MRHVFVETNWVVAAAAPAHHQIPAAVDLLREARSGSLRLYVPGFCFSEARRPILLKQPRHEADAIRHFLNWKAATTGVNADEAAALRRLLSEYEVFIRAELQRLDERLRALKSAPGVEMYPLTDSILRLSLDARLQELDLRPFDQMVLAAVLGRAKELRAAGENDFSFCELDADLQPWNREGTRLARLGDLYDEHGVWVYRDFQMQSPPRPATWPPH